MKPIRQILCPTDYSACSDAALIEAVGMARQFDAHLTLLHVQEMPIFALGDPGFTGNAELFAQMQQRAKQDLERLAAKTEKDLGRRVAWKTAMGSPAREIVDEARTGEYDLVVIGTHGRTGVQHLLIGSTAERVVQLAPCRVLTVHA